MVTSRKESHLYNELNSVSSTEIAPEDIDADVATFVEAKVAASSRLSHPLVRELVVTKLCNAHDGMFLWLFLVLKELKSCMLLERCIFLQVADDHFLPDWIGESAGFFCSRSGQYFF